MPVGILSAVFTLVILYLSLDPDPIKQPSFLSFYGADKIVHFLMYFALTSAYLFDYVILKYPHRTRTNKELALTAVAILLGGLIEVLQLYMGLGRSRSNHWIVVFKILHNKENSQYQAQPSQQEKRARHSRTRIINKFYTFHSI